VKLTGYRQQVFDTPFYYESESSAGYYRMYFADTNGPTGLNYSAARADTFHQLLLPWTFFNWLNVTPHVGGRFTYYSSETGPGGTNSATWRNVFNTGVGTSFKASQLWTGATNSLLPLTVCATSLSRRRIIFTCPRPARRRRNCRSSIPRRPACCCCRCNSRLQQH